MSKLKNIDDAWLNLDGVDTKNIINPFDIVNLNQDDFHYRLLWLMTRPEYFSFLCKHMNLDEDYETDSESSSDDAPTWKDPTSGNTVCKAMFKFLKQSEDESTRKRNALAGKSLLQSALFSSKPQSSKSPSHRLTLSNLEWLELLDKEDKEEEAYS